MVVQAVPTVFLITGGNAAHTPDSKESGVVVFVLPFATPVA
jgi:hypothetical protein